MLDDEVDAKILRSRVEELLDDRQRRENLARNMGSLATPEAADKVAGRLLEAANATPNSGAMNQKGTRA
ncbi:MAG: hypothetical protein LC751_00835 [Actinobacteria bacterium]|nr:hypothetical protein [Actinomycetota bacterium]